MSEAFSRYGVRFQWSGQEMKTYCIPHDEQNPAVSPSTSLACQECRTEEDQICGCGGFLDEELTKSMDFRWFLMVSSEISDRFGEALTQREHSRGRL